MVKYEVMKHCTEGFQRNRLIQTLNSLHTFSAILQTYFMYNFSCVKISEFSLYDAN